MATTATRPAMTSMRWRVSCCRRFRISTRLLIKPGGPQAALTSFKVMVVAIVLHAWCRHVSGHRGAVAEEKLGAGGCRSQLGPVWTGPDDTAHRLSLWDLQTKI